MSGRDGRDFGKGSERWSGGIGRVGPKVVAIP
jgi:hypothetical protein